MTKPFITRIESYNNIVTHFMSDGTYKETSIVYILDRIRWLEDQHKRLHKEVEELEKKNPYSDILKERKRDKLTIKDEITKLTAKFESDSGVENFA